MGLGGLRLGGSIMPNYKIYAQLNCKNKELYPIFASTLRKRCGILLPIPSVTGIAATIPQLLWPNAHKAGEPEAGAGAYSTEREKT
jgi:hypothetical protein